MMTRKDYIATADILNQLWRDAVVAKVQHEDALPSVEIAIAKFCEMFHDDNPNFDRSRFIKAVTK